MNGKQYLFQKQQQTKEELQQQRAIVLPQSTAWHMNSSASTPDLTRVGQEEQQLQQQQRQGRYGGQQRRRSLDMPLGAPPRRKRSITQEDNPTNDSANEPWWRRGCKDRAVQSQGSQNTLQTATTATTLTSMGAGGGGGGQTEESHSSLSSIKTATTGRTTDAASLSSSQRRVQWQEPQVVILHHHPYHQNDSNNNNNTKREGDIRSGTYEVEAAHDVSETSWESELMDLQPTTQRQPSFSSLASSSSSSIGANGYSRGIHRRSSPKTTTPFNSPERVETDNQVEVKDYIKSGDMSLPSRLVPMLRRKRSVHPQRAFASAHPPQHQNMDESSSSQSTKTTANTASAQGAVPPANSGSLLHMHSFLIRFLLRFFSPNSRVVGFVLAGFFSVMLIASLLGPFPFSSGPLRQRRMFLRPFNPLLEEQLIAGGILPGIFENSSSPSLHRHAIPNTIIMTHYLPLLDLDLTGPVRPLPAFGVHHEPSKEEWEEWKALQANVLHTLELHPDATVRFLTDDECVKSLRHYEASRQPFWTINTDGVQHFSLADAFHEEPVGMFKADLCRGAALWETGGLYTDVDLGVRMSLWEVLKPETTFATVRVHFQSLHPGAFFQAFIAAQPRSNILDVYLQLFALHYQGTLDPPLEKASDPVGVILLRRAANIVLEMQRQSGDDQGKEVGDTLEMHGEDENVVGVKTSSSHIDMETDAWLDVSTIEIWQEILYRPDLHSTVLSHVPPPTWGGSRRACHFVVLAGPKEPAVVPFYSRIAGSRMCPVNDDEKHESPVNDEVASETNSEEE